MDNFRKALGPGSDCGICDVQKLVLNHSPASDFRREKCRTFPAGQQTSAVGNHLFHAMLIITAALGVERQLFAGSLFQPADSLGLVRELGC